MKRLGWSDFTVCDELGVEARRLVAATLGESLQVKERTPLTLDRRLILDRDQLAT